MEKEETRIIFTSPEEMAGRRKHIKAFKNVKERPQLVEDSNEKVRNVCELMILEGFSDEMIDWLLTLCSDPDKVETLDFLHMAVLVMGEDFVRERIVGKVLTLEEACRLLREDYHEDQMKPYREIYENLDAKIRAALEGEDKVSHQIEILKLQSEHADEMYKQRMETAKVQYTCDLKIEKNTAKAEKERLEEKITSLTKELEEAKAENTRQKKEYEKLLKDAVLLSRREEKKKQEAAKGTERPPDAADGEKKPWCFGRKRQEKKPEEEKAADAPIKGDEKNAEKEETPILLSPEDERREFCLSALGNLKFTGEQIELILPCMLDENVPLTALNLLCRPELPAANMRGFIRFIEGGKNENGKE